MQQSVGLSIRDHWWCRLHYCLFRAWPLRRPRNLCLQQCREENICCRRYACRSWHQQLEALRQPRGGCFLLQRTVALCRDGRPHPCLHRPAKVQKCTAHGPRKQLGGEESPRKPSSREHRPCSGEGYL
ncbi:unnamed protein product [Ectocarpus sp. 12 AP-2014]